MNLKFPKRPSKNSKIREWIGPLTRKLTQSKASFGLGQVPENKVPDSTVDLICGYCGTGCSLQVHLKEGKAVNLSADSHYPVNLGMACPKGWEALTPLYAPDRATTPMVRNPKGQLVPSDWDTAGKTFVQRFKRIQQEHGEDALAWLSTGQIVAEEMAYLGALCKFGMGIKHGDGNTRQCMATAVVAYKQSLGFDAPPYTYKDFEESDVLFFVGANPAIAHPIMWQRVMMNRNQPQVIVIDPRFTETAMAATQHLAIKPKSDLNLLYGIAKILIEKNWIDPSFIDQNTNGFAEFCQFLKTVSLDQVEADSGIAKKTIYALAETIHRGKRVSFWWTMGVNQSYQGVRTVQAMINIVLMTGNIGRPGTGANSITGQCNAMGSRLFSNSTNLLGGHDFLNAEHRKKISSITQVPLDKIPDTNSLAYDQIIDAIHSGKIKGLWMIATNGAHSWIHQKGFVEAIKKLDTFVVQDIYHNTATTELADIVLPASGWGEKEGIFINSERRLGVIRKVKAPPGKALSDFNIFRLISHYWGCQELFEKWDKPESVFQILKQCSANQPCDFTGIKNYQMIEERGGIQWPFTTADQEKPYQPERRLFENGKFYTPDQKAKFLFESSRPIPEAPNHEYPFILLTGRGTSAQWHTQTRTGKSAILRKLYPAEIYLEINPQDAQKLQIQPNQKVAVISPRGKISATAHIAPTVQEGQIFIPMHYRIVNQLTHPSFDPYSREPNYKICAVKLFPEKSKS